MSEYRSPFVATTVGIDDYYPALPALVRTDYRWNGWAVPYFDRETVSVIAELLERDRLDDDDPYIVFDGEVVRLVQPRNDDEPSQVVDPVVIDGKLMYSVGGMDWCWHELDETEEAS